MVRRSKSHDAAAREVWRLLFDTFMISHPERQAALGERGLTPNDSRALYTLDRGEGRAIGALARRWNCDPSTATWVVDRLERAGLAERRPSADDRRVKLVALTAKGEATVKELSSIFFEPPPALDSLDRDELDALKAILGKLVPDRRLSHNI